MYISTDRETHFASGKSTNHDFEQRTLRSKPVSLLPYVENEQAGGGMSDEPEGTIHTQLRVVRTNVHLYYFL